MAAKNIRATARVRMEIEMPVPGHWGPTAAIEQIKTQATEAALGLLRAGGLIVNGVHNPSFGEAALKGIVRTVGEPKVTAVLVEEEP